MASIHRQKIVIDTDCGIDDAIAMLLALSSNDISETLAVTCCYGNTSIDNVCSNVKRVLTICEQKEIPIYRGCSGPLIQRNCPIETVHGSDGLGECAQEFSDGGLQEDETPASLALINLAKKYPHQITVIAVAPLTNLAVAHRLDPSFTQNLKSIVIMGGNYKGVGNVTEVAEFNFYCDPESANIIVTESLCSVVLVPWETTMEYGIKWDMYNDLLSIKSRKVDFFGRFSEYAVRRGKKKGNKQLYDCDFLAVFAFLYPQKVTSSFKSFLRVECQGEIATGLTVLERNPGNTTDRKQIEIITNFDFEFLNYIRRKMLSE